MHPATALDIETRGSWLYQKSKVQINYTMELKTRQEKCGDEGGRLCANAKNTFVEGWE